MNRLIQKVLDACFPPSDDAVRAQRVQEAALMRRTSINRSSSGVYTALPYRDPNVRAVVRANKFYADAHSAKVLASVLFDMLVYIEDEHALEPLWKTPLLVPIPSSKKKLRERGYNQVERIIECLPKETLASMEYTPNALARHDRESQARISREARAKNIRSAFFVPPKQMNVLQGRAVLLIDDVSESGATMKDAVRALKEAGVAAVIGIALAK